MIFQHVYQRQRLRAAGVNFSATPHSPVTFEGAGKLASFNPNFCCVQDNINNKFYIGEMAIGGLQRDPWILKFDPVLNRIEQVRRVAIGLTPLNADTHRGPIMDVDSSGNVYMVCELLDEDEGHGSVVLVYKTSTPGDLFTLTLIQTLAGRWSYPFVKVSGNNVFISARGSTGGSFIRGQQWYWNSTDGGANFGSPVKLYDSDNEDTQVAYIFEHANYDGGISFVLNERSNTLTNWTFVAFITGTWNSDVWSNASGSFTKNVSSAGHITRTQMATNYLVVESSDYNTIAVNYEGGATKSDGSIRVLISMQTLTGNEFEGNPETELDELRMYYLRAGVWEYETVTIPTGWVFYWAMHRYITYLNNDSDTDDICFIDPTDDHDVKIISSSNEFTSQTSRLLLEGNGNYRQHKISFNAEEPDESMVVIVDTKGDMFEIEAETALDYSNIVILQT